MKYLGTAAALGLVALSLNAHEVKDLGAGREVMWDMDRISALGGGAKLTLHHPQLREVSLVHDAPWEGNVCCYHTVLRDDRNYKMYYRGCAWNLPGYKNHQVVCYAESDDGAPVPGFALEDAQAVYGDDVDLALAWKSGSDVSALAGRTVSLHFEIKDADLYSYRFGR
ncbi:MAG: hypothetical protein IKE55_01240 [Kiritimatiellae bacterium]|nr:hypothetical protein [Kiritimatiellia bacterium]